MTTVDDLTPDIAELLDSGMSAQAVAQELIVPLNDVLRVLEQRRHAAGAPSASPPPAPRLAVVRPLGEPAVTTPPPTSNLDLISRGRDCGVSRIVRLAEKAETAMATLTVALEEHEEQAEARARVDRLKAELKAAEAALRPGRATSTSTSAGDQVDTKTVRAWARENGHQVPDRGTLPAAVVAAYQQAHPA